MLDTARFVGAAVAPAVMISACGLFCLALYNRLAAIVGRLRALSRERLREAEVARPEGGRVARWVRRMLGRGSEGVLGRARLIRDALTCLLGAVVCLAVSSLAAGLGTVWRPCAYLGLAAFVVGDLLIVAGLSLALWELRLALHPAELEARMVGTMLDARDRRAEAA